MSPIQTGLEPPALETAALPEVFRRLSGEVSRLARDCDGLQASLGRIAAAQTDPGLVVDAQTIDCVVQRLVALASFMTLLSAASPAIDVELDAALADLTLSDLVSRLAGRSASCRTAELADGAMELF